MPEVTRHLATEYLHSEPWWEWQIPVYLFLGGLAAGVLVLNGLQVARHPRGDRSDTFRLLAWLGPLVLGLGMFALWLDLERRWMVPRFYLAFRATAPMSWGSWILLAVFPAALLHALGELPERWKLRLGGAGRIRGMLGAGIAWADRDSAKRRLAWSNVAVGVLLGIYTGVLLSALSARPLWNSAILGPLFLVSGLSTGAAAMLLFRLDARERHWLGRVDAGLIAAELVLLALFLVTLATGGAVQQEAGRLLLGGAYTAGFWGLVVIGGLGVPLVAEIGESRGLPGSRWFVPALVLVGGLSLRWILVASGQASGWVIQ